MKDAKEQGYFTDMPLYHGTNKDFNEFNLLEGVDPSRSVSRSPVGKLGVSLATDSKLANEFASRAGGEGMNVIPALHRLCWLVLLLVTIMRRTLIDRR